MKGIENALQKKHFYRVIFMSQMLTKGHENTPLSRNPSRKGVFPRLLRERVSGYFRINAITLFYKK